MMMTKETEMNIGLLIVTNERIQAETLSLGLSVYGHRCICAANNKDALEILREENKDEIDLVIADLSNPGWSGFEMIMQIRCARPELPIVVITGLKTPLAVFAVRKMGIPVLRAPYDPAKLDGTIRKLLGKELDSSNR
jgi:DNA-binding response OmpR family regulator